MRLYGKWQVTLPDGESYVWEPDETTLAEELMLETELDGSTFDEWLVGIDQRKAIPCQVLVWFLRRQAGRQEDRMSVNFPIRRLELTQVEEAEPVPEAPAGSEESEPATSPLSLLA